MADAGEQGRGAGSRGRALALVLLVLAAILGPIALRALVEGRAELAEADAATTSEQAIVHLGRAARWRLPLASHDEQARARLEQIAQAAEAAQDDALALVAWRELRGALLGTRSWAIVDAEQLERANLGIVRAMVAQARAAGENESGEVESGQRWLAELEAPPASDDRATRLGAIWFALWCATTIGFVLRGIDPDGRSRRRPALVWGLSSLALLLAWILTM